MVKTRSALRKPRFCRPCKANGLIIATGGGVVTRPENYTLLRQNGRMYWLQRPIDDLSMEGRVLSGNSREKLHQLF